jgi:hypothetical protein
MSDFKVSNLCIVEWKIVVKLIGEILGEMDSVLC